MALGFKLSFAIAAAAGLAAVPMACASGSNEKSATSTGTLGSGGAATTGQGGTGGKSAGAGAGATESSNATFMGSDAGQVGGGNACAKFTASATQAPAAIVFVVDKSASMNVKINGISKWNAAQLAIVQAIDNAAFDGISLGLLAFPHSKETGPACVFHIQVSCGISALPDVAIANAGTLKSNASTGVRHEIYQYLSNAAPLDNQDDGSPDYDALNAAYNALKGVSGVAKRIAVLVSDGGFSCTSLSNPMRPGYDDLNDCPDWEEPPTVNTLISKAYSDPTAPVNTLIVGVPGSNSDGQKQGIYDTPPYNMLLALSTYAVSGSPNTVNPSCDTTAMFTQTGAAPTHPCHIDLSNGANFSTQALAQALNQIRGQVLGCIYDLPSAPPGQTINPSLVNVLLTLNGMMSTLPRRANASDMCTTAGCWDYVPGNMNQVELVGQACTEVESAAMASVEIEVGCKTVIK